MGPAFPPIVRGWPPGGKCARSRGSGGVEALGAGIEVVGKSVRLSIWGMDGAVAQQIVLVRYLLDNLLP